MQKTWYAIVALVVLGASAVGASALAGKVLGQRLSQQTAQLEKLLPHGGGIHPKVKRGLFSSTRDLTIPLGCAAPTKTAANAEPQPQVPIALQWHDTIKHGPFPSGQALALAVIDSELLVPADWQTSWLGDQPLLTIHTKVGFDGGFASTLRMPAIKHTGEANIAFSGLTFVVTGTYPASTGTVTYQGSVAPLSFTADAGESTLALHVGDTRLKGSTQIAANAATWLLPFKHETSIAELALQLVPPRASGRAGQPMNVTIGELTTTSESRIDSQLWSNTNTLRGRVQVDDFALDHAEMTVALRRLHMPTLEKLLNTLIEASVSCDPNHGDKPRFGDLAALASTGFELLLHEPEYEVGPMAIEFAGKRAELSYGVSVHGVTPGDQQLPWVALLMQRAKAHVELKAHLGLIEELAKFGSKVADDASAVAAHHMADVADVADVPAVAVVADHENALEQPAQVAPKPLHPEQVALAARTMVDKFVDDGYLVREGDYVRSRFETSSGVFKLNGKPFSLPNLGELAPGGNP
ncbi:MAG: hypothetical protein RL701_8161 [Pseudomonadota bacterium]